jgi:tetratricopeptide (TPR) repeat protein
MLRKLAGLVALLTWLPVALGQSPETQVDRIRAALRAREFDAAVELARAALQKSPNNAELWTLQGVALLNKGENKDSLAAFRRAIQLSPRDANALAGAAQIEYQADDPEAVTLLTRLLQLRPEDPTAHAMIAVLEYRRGKCVAAAQHFAQASEIINSQLDGLHAYATCLVRLKKLDQAEEVFQRALALRPDDARERQVLASLQLMLHQPKDALSTLTPLLGAGNASADTLELASSAFEDAGDTPQAVSSLRQAILLEPRNVSLYLDFAMIALAHESFQVGISVIDEGLALQPRVSQLYVARGVLYVQLAQYEKAESDFATAEELDPGQPLSTAALGLAAGQFNDVDHALAAVQAKLKASPREPMFLYLQAYLWSQKGVEPGTTEFQLALNSIEQALALQPNMAAARVVLAKFYMQTQQYKEAAVQCRKALANHPNDQTAVYRLIQALRKIGDTREIPELSKRLALLRAQVLKDDRDKYRYKLIEENATPEAPAKP